MKQNYENTPEGSLFPLGSGVLQKLKGVCPRVVLHTCVLPSSRKPRAHQSPYELRLLELCSAQSGRPHTRQLLSGLPLTSPHLICVIVLEGRYHFPFSQLKKSKFREIKYFF